MPKTAPEMTKSDIFSEDLPVMLNTDELADAAGKLAEQFKEKADLEGDKKKATTDFNTKISVRKKEIEELTGVINNGELRAVECQWHFHWEDGIKTLIRLDTNEEVRTESINAADKQMNLKLEEASA